MNNFSKNFEEIDLEIHGVRLPRFEVSKDYVNKSKLKGEFNNFNFLRYACLEKFESLQLEKGSPLYEKYCERIKYELDTLKELGFIDYILMVWDVVKFYERRRTNWTGKRKCCWKHGSFLAGSNKNRPS